MLPIIRALPSQIEADNDRMLFRAPSYFDIDPLRVWAQFLETTKTALPIPNRDTWEIPINDDVTTSRLLLPACCLSRIFEAIDPAFDFQDNTHGAAMVLEAWASDLIRDFEARLGHDISIQPIRHVESFRQTFAQDVYDFESEIRFVNLWISFDGEVKKYMVVLELQSAHCAAFDALARSRARSAGQFDFPFLVSQLAGWTNLTVRELTGLRFGDVIVAGVGTYDAPMYSVATFGVWGQFARAEDETLRLLGPKRTFEQFLSEVRIMNGDDYEFDDEGNLEAPDALDETLDAADELAIDEIPLTVFFEIGSEQLPLSDLAQITEGYTFQLKRSLPDVVTLVVNGKRVGRGELVDISGQLGVRVTRLNNLPGPS